jgi:EEF1A N-terminal glycine/lysine methyltransferase
MAHLSVARRPSVPPTAVAATPTPAGLIADKVLRAQSDQKPRPKSSSSSVQRTNQPIINISPFNNNNNNNTNTNTTATTITSDLADELDYITVSPPSDTLPNVRPDKASRILGIKHRKSMEPIPASARNSIVSTRSARNPPPAPSFTPTLPLASLYVVSGLPKSPHTWTLADPDAVLGLNHAEGAVNRWWRPEVLGSTISPGAGGGKKKKRGKTEEILKGAGALSKQEVGKMLSKALKVRNSTFFSIPLILTFP